MALYLCKYGLAWRLILKLKESKTTKRLSLEQSWCPSAHTFLNEVFYSLPFSTMFVSSSMLKPFWILLLACKWCSGHCRLEKTSGMSWNFSCSARGGSVEMSGGERIVWGGGRISTSYTHWIPMICQRIFEVLRNKQIQPWPWGHLRGVDPQVNLFQGAEVGLEVYMRNCQSRWPGISTQPGWSDGQGAEKIPGSQIWALLWLLLSSSGFI